MANSLPLIATTILSGIVLLQLSLGKKWEALATSISGTSIIVGLYGVTR